jgi:hypothetical protein
MITVIDKRNLFPTPYDYTSEQGRESQWQKT